MIDRRTGAKKLEMWTAEEGGHSAPDFAAPTGRPPSRRPNEQPHRRAEDSTEVQEVAPPVAPPAEERPAARRPAQTEEPALAKEVPADKDSGGEFRWPKQGEETEDDKESISADSPLLSRAFRAAK